MALRLVEIYHQRGKAEEIDFLFKDAPILDIWHDLLPDGETITKVLLTAKNTDFVLDILHNFYSEKGTDYKSLRLFYCPAYRNPYGINNGGGPVNPSDCLQV